MVFYSYHIYLIKQLFDFVNTSSKTNSSAGTSRGCTTHHGSDHAHINPRDHAYVANRIFMIYIPIQVRPHLIPEQMWALLYIELALVLEDEDDWALGTGHVANGLADYRFIKKPIDVDLFQFWIWIWSG